MHKENVSFMITHEKFFLFNFKRISCEWKVELRWLGHILQGFEVAFHLADFLSTNSQ